MTDLVGTANGTLIDSAHVAGGQLVLDGKGDFVQFANHLIPITGERDGNRFQCSCRWCASGKCPWLCVIGSCL